MIRIYNIIFKNTFYNLNNVNSTLLVLKKKLFNTI